MASETNHPPPYDPQGLPPVAPPSGRFIAQLFLVPGLIVFVLVLIWLMGNYLVAEQRNPKYFLDSLDNANEDIRWRAASDLAQVLKRPESLEMASDPVFALELAQRLRSAWANLRQDEKAAVERTQGWDDQEKRKEWKKLDPQRHHVQFLISALGAFTTPVGAPLLCEIAADEEAVDLKTATLRRRQTVWALSNLGANLKRFQELPTDKQQAIIDRLKEEKEKPGDRGRWAAAAYHSLTGQRPLGVDACLEKCSRSQDTFLRELVAHAFNFWDGPHAEPTLRRLARDDGHGTRIELREED